MSNDLLAYLTEHNLAPQSKVTVERQTNGKYVLRGFEAGGATPDVGYYVSYATPKGDPHPYLQVIDTLGNGRHAIVVSPGPLLRLEMLRVRSSCTFAVTEFQLEEDKQDKGKPLPTTHVRLLAREGRLPDGLDLTGADHNLCGTVLPTFFSPSGELYPVPKRFDRAARSLVRAVCCLRCTHNHYTEPAPVPDTVIAPAQEILPAAS